MNQINGYCQIELPDRISLSALKTTTISLTDDEAKTIAKALNLDQVVTDANGYHSYDNAWLGKPIYVLAYTYDDASADKERKSVFSANIQSEIHGSEFIYITFDYVNGNTRKSCMISIGFGSGEPGEPIKWEIIVNAEQITTTHIQ